MVLWSQKCRLTSVLSKCIRWEIYRLCSLVETSITLDLSSCNLYILHVLVHIIVSWGLISWISLPSPSAFSDLVDLIKGSVSLCFAMVLWSQKWRVMSVLILLWFVSISNRMYTHTHTHTTHTQRHTHKGMYVCGYIYMCLT